MKILFFLMFSLNVFAQTGTLSGKVVDKETGEPLIGANVIIKELNIGAATDINGEYKIKSVKHGLYSVFATYIGYIKQHRNSVNIQSNSTLINFEMEPDSLPSDIIILERPTKNVSSCEPPYDFLKPKGLTIDTLLNNPKRHMPVSPVLIK